MSRAGPYEALYAYERQNRATTHHAKSGNVAQIRHLFTKVGASKRGRDKRDKKVGGVEDLLKLLLAGLIQGIVNAGHALP